MYTSKKRELFLLLSGLMFCLVFCTSINHMLMESIMICDKGFYLVLYSKIFSVLICGLLAYIFGEKVHMYSSFLLVFLFCNLIFTLFFYSLKEFFYLQVMMLILMQIIGDLYCMFSMMYFWQIANKVFSFKEAKSIYPNINIVGTLGSFLGYLVSYTFSFLETSKIVFLFFGFLIFLGVIKYMLFYKCYRIADFEHLEKVEENACPSSDKIGILIALSAFTSIFCHHIFEYMFKFNISLLANSTSDYLERYSVEGFLIATRNIILSCVFRACILWMNWFAMAVFGPILSFFVGGSLLFLDAQASVLLLSYYMSIARAAKSIFMDPAKNSALIFLPQNKRIFYKKVETVLERLAKIANSCVMLFFLSEYLYLLNVGLSIMWVLMVKKISKNLRIRKSDPQSRNSPQS